MPGKKSDKTPTETFMQLLIFLLEHSQPVTLGELAMTLKVSKQSVLKYLDRIDLTYFGKLERQKRGKEVVFVFEPNVKKIRKIGSRLYKLHLFAFKKESAEKNKF